MNTSYFTKSANHPNAVSIARVTPKWYNGREYKKLAPPWELIEKYKNDGDWDYYTEHYYKRVLDLLDFKQVYKELGEDVILLCYEDKNKYCHRELVAEWFKNKLGIEVKEL